MVPLPFFTNATRVLAGILIPDTPLLNASIAFAHDALPDWSYNHVMASWLNGQAIINHMPPEKRALVDQEAFGVATILHDIGWSYKYGIMSNDKIFEVDGAEAAREFIRREGGKEWDERRLQLVWDSIALHSFVEVSKYKEIEAQLTAAGTSTELFGIEASKQTWGNLVTVTQEEWDGIKAVYPRLPGSIKEFEKLMIHFCAIKPQVTWNSPVGDYGEKYLEGYSRVGHRYIDVIESLSDS